MITFHGKEDEVFPVNNVGNAQDVIFSPYRQTLYNSESGCLLQRTGSYTLEGNANTVDLVSGSGLNMYNIARNQNPPVPAELHTGCQMGHGTDDHTITYFGTGLSSTSGVATYITQRAAVFFQAVMNGIGNNLNKRTFIDCENKRIKCNTANNFNCSTPDCTLLD